MNVVDGAAKFGFSEFTTWPWSFQRDLERFRAHGADVIEICEFKLAHDDYDEMELLKSSGLTPASIQMKVHSVFVDSMANKPEDPPDRIDAMKRAIAGTAPHVPPGTPFIVITGIAPKGNFRKAVDQTADALKDLGDFAAEHRVNIAFEPLSPINIDSDTAIWYLDQGLELVERVSHPNVGLCVDSWNVWQTCDLHDVIAQCGDRIMVVQLSDWRTPRSRADRFSLGTGRIDLERMIAAIRRTGYTGPWVVEILSSFHLEGSLWKRNLDDVLEENCKAFQRLWKATEPLVRAT